MFLAVAVSLFASVALAQGREVARDYDGARHVILRPAAPLTETDRAELAGKGILVQRPTTEGRYLARVAENASDDSRIAALEPLSAEEKIHSSAFREAARGSVWANVSVYFHDDIRFENARGAILASGGALQDVLAVGFTPMRQLRAKIPPFALTTLAADDRVLMISGPRNLKVQTHNVNAAHAAHVDDIQSVPYGLTGAGVAVSLFELAPAQDSHVEFNGRLTVNATGGSGGNRTHATHVAGTIGATGLRAEAKGMAPSATLTQFCVPEPANTCNTDWQTIKDTQLASRGVVADNNSWGYVIGWSTNGGMWLWEDTAEYWGAYDYEFTAPIDQITRDRNVLFVHSSGNEGDDGPNSEWGDHRHTNPDTGNADTSKTHCYSKNLSGTDCPVSCSGTCETTKHHTLSPYDTLSVTGAAKNALTVGAINADGSLLALSSRGPAKDGRVKPDVVARGAFTLSSVPTNSYATSSGTSMAAPVVTGIAALLTEQWRRTFAKTPTPAQLKAVIIAGAEDLGAAGPDYAYGFGMVNAKTSVDFVINDNANSKHIRNVTIAQGQQVEFPIVVQQQQNVRVVLHWSDPPIFLPESQIHIAKALVNDLDLKVIGPTGTEVLPYVLDKTNVSNAATRGVNTIDNTEMVEIANAAPGAYRIRVAGTGVVEGPQTAVIVTTARAARTCVDQQEPNDSTGGAFGNLSPNSTIGGGFCASGDVDFYKFAVTKAGPISVNVTAGDTPLRVSISSSQANTSIDVPAYETRTLTTTSVTGSNASPLNATLKIEPAAALGVEPDYTFTLTFGQDGGKRRRSVRP